ncbi:MAG: YeeE/YedE family protein [Alphaproteobacteria bacterium]|nr:YeeE/YedE family protein [Alphaproteobacteria bacterium]
MTFFIPILSGALFGAGLLVSGMTDPSKVLGFLNIFGLWDPSLILVMGGGLIVSFLGSRWAQGTQRPWFDITFSWPKKQKIDGALVIGSAIFGIGWGLAGICPGPAIAGLGSFIPSIILFFLPMIAGLFLGHWTRNFWESKNVG